MQYSLRAHLDPQETPVEPIPSPPPVETAPAPDGPLDNFRHSGWSNHRRRIWDSMLRVGVEPARRCAFAHCGTDAWILRNKADPELFRVVPDHCHDRSCVPCAGHRQAVIRRNLLDKIADRPHRFLTLTIRHDQEPLRVLIARLYSGFRRLRQRVLWEERVDGGVAFLELTYDATRGSWNPHLHAVLDGKYFDLQDLRTLWLSCTGDSHNIKIKLIRRKPDAVWYVTKYATKPLPPSVVEDPDALDEALRVLKGRRTVLCFGTWRRWRLLADPPDEAWELYDHLAAVQANVLDDPLCENILAMLCTADPSTGEFYVHVESPEPEP